MFTILRSIYLPVCLVVFMLSCTGQPETNQQPAGPEPEVIVNKEWVYRNAAGSVLRFKGRKEFDTNLFDLTYIGQIKNKDKAPYLIFSGRYCTECDANISIYIHSPSDGKLEVDQGANRYQYPGTVRHYEDETLLYKARAFFGQVLPGITGLIWYQEDLMEDQTWHRSVFLADLTTGTKKDTILTDSGQINETLKLLDLGLCQEIKGLALTSEP